MPATLALPRRRSSPTAQSARRKASGRTTTTIPQPATNGLLLHVPATAFTHRGFRDWVTAEGFPDKMRVAYLSGEIYLDMSKEELETHAKVKSEVCRVLLGLNHDLDLGDLYLDGVLVTNEEVELSTNPDGTLVTHKSLRSGRVKLVESREIGGLFVELRGSPDWLLEIVSQGSVVKDTVTLKEMYHAAGVREYWVIDARGDEIVFQILLWRKSGYVAAPSRGGWHTSRVFGREFRLVRERDRWGLWKYTLEMREP